MRNFGLEVLHMYPLISSINNLYPYEDIIKKYTEKFDTREYPKVSGVINDKGNQKILSHFMGLGSKQYAYRCIWRRS